MIVAPLAVLGLLAVRWREGVWAWRAPAYLCLGFALGQIANPYFPGNLEYLMFHVLWKTSNTLNLPVGREWLPAHPLYLLRHTWVLLMGMGALWSLCQRQRRELGADTLAFAATTLLFVILTLKHGRFFEYLLPTMVALLALLWRDSGAFSRRWIWGGTVLCMLLAGWQAAKVRSMHQNGAVVDHMRAVSRAVQTRTKAGEIILNYAWEDYPFLVLHNPHNRYVIGLDPYYLAYQSPKRYSLWHRLRYTNKPVSGDLLRRAFGARYMIARHRHTPRLKKLHDVVLVQRFRDASLWRIGRKER